jgi:hypothetical protein
MVRLGLRLALVLSVAGCAAMTTAPGTPTPSAQPPESMASGPTPFPTYEPGPHFASGAITRADARGVVVQSPDGELAVDFTEVRSVWKETEVAPSDLEVGDQLDLNGTRSGATFRARSVSANIGRFDGVIRALAGDTIELASLPPSTRTFQVELSRYLKVVRGADIPATVADLQPGLSISGVVYRPKNATPRATKIWFSVTNFAGATPTWREFKIQQLRDEQAQREQGAKGPRYGPGQTAGADPAASLNLVPKPRIVWSEPCPADQPNCARLAAPLAAGLRNTIRITNYYTGGPLMIFAAESLTQPGTGVIVVGDVVFPLPADRGVPRLVALTDGIAEFVTTSGPRGSLGNARAFSFADSP